MPIQLTASTLQRTRVAPPVQKEEAAAQQAAVQEIPNIPKRNQLVVGRGALQCGRGDQERKNKREAMEGLQPTSSAQRKGRGIVGVRERIVDKRKTARMNKTGRGTCPGVGL